MFYTYDSGNKLLRVSDGSNHPEGFKDGANTTIEYGYDAFGNMTRDDNKSITSITYNHLNLPKQILFSGIPNRKINYLYNALGQKVEKKITNNLTETVTNYQGMFHYENQVLKFIGTSEGYVNVTSGRRTENGPSYVFNYVYNYTDHLGNIRVSYTNNGINAAIIEENHYYPFGLKHKKYGMADPVPKLTYQYKYNGQEWQDDKLFLGGVLY